MKHYLLLTIWVIFWVVMESTVLYGFPYSTLKFDMVFLALLSISFTNEWWQGLPKVILIGFIMDAVSFASFGTITIVYVFTFAVIRFATSSIYIQSILARFVWVIAATVIAELAKMLLTSRFAGALWSLLPQAVLNGTLGIFIIPLFEWYIALTWEKIVKPKGLVFK